ncbi:hypothetical protein HNQ93_002028 [Hymenobacter luteus]|uniref:Uncharacterized protein n=2 Tax=Hymenobacter TaxID=89966 RepID=A0A7W9WD03_9BACT|nr:MULTISPECIES: hypothetical protein [Hymenobacter]MBB4600611.1 hypothetical protein [Hymenobacter latericoloratus]MBB6059182.1 hypothetical protein [Hymenobacter luteus]
MPHYTIQIGIRNGQYFIDHLKSTDFLKPPEGQANVFHVLAINDFQGDICRELYLLVVDPADENVFKQKENEDNQNGRHEKCRFSLEAQAVVEWGSPFILQHCPWS